MPIPRPKEAFTVKHCEEDGQWMVTGGELLPGLFLCGKSLRAVLRDIEPAWKQLNRIRATENTAKKEKR